MFSRKQLSQARKDLDAQLKKSGNVTSKLTDAQRQFLLEMFGKWKRKNFKMLPISYGYRAHPIGTIDDIEKKMSTALESARQFCLDEKFAAETVNCSVNYNHGVQVAGCLPMSDAALAVKYTKQFKKIEKAKQSRKNKTKAARDAAKQTALLNKTIALRDVAKLLKEISQLKTAAKVSKKAAKSVKRVKRTKKAKKPVNQTIFPFESNGRG